MSIPFQKSAVQILRDIAASESDCVFLIDSETGAQLTYGEFNREAFKIAGILRGQGLQKGDRIITFFPNSILAAKFYFGCLYAGIVAVPLNPILAGPEVKYIIDDSGAKAFFAIAPLTANLSFMQQVVIKKILLKESPGSPALPLDGWEYADFKKPLPDINEFLNISDDDDHAIFYTSGTTAHPKGVLHKVSDIIFNSEVLGRELGITPQNRFYNILSMSYLGGFHNLLFLPYINLASVVISKTFGLQHSLNFWDAVARFQINTLWLTPSIMTILLEMDRGTLGVEYASKNISLCLCGTAPLPVEIRKSFEARYKIQIYENYGISETLFFVANTPKDKVKDGSVGKVLPLTQVCISKLEEGESLLPKEGEIWVKTPFMMKGYIKGKVVENACDGNGWFQTGDIGYFDEDNYLYISGRKKDLIIRGGINISPASIERVIGSHPAVAECAVVGIPDRMLGENIHAVVRLFKKNYEKETDLQIIKLCNENLAKIKIPAQIHFVESLPKNSNGKIMKRSIKEELIKGCLNEVKKETQC